ncbi:uncharacterized protein N7446_011407 [Penicillium canescens]|uniref:Uncharacterized protein n=1 Tax=Penicillium canescens TaxID=5083 RepID=A0AAD6IIK1_PENCN|nr:uncharacterized protein N7446_011407 [Penicillium canescens]KAJ6047677.1 hypothetical protein N7460_003824 [Penicillium canescens]KAJ6048724.1 hypothetical protein N7446_011407 [Penicillium canescens]
MTPKIIGNAAPWKQVSDARTSELNAMQESFYETAIIWARVTGEKTLDDSIHATPKSQLQAQMRWKEAYQSYISPLASESRTEVIHRSVVSSNKTEPHAASMLATARYSDAAAAVDADTTENPGHDEEPGKIDKTSTDGNTQGDEGFRPPASAKVFMSSFRALRLANAAVAAAAAAEPSPPRRLLFKNLPKWVTVSHVLHLVYGGVIERAWSETSGEVNVQFTDADDCNRYLEMHPESIPLKVGDDVINISIELMDNDNEHPELARRLRADASRVVCLSGLPTSLMGKNDENILGIASQPNWESKALEQVLITNGEEGILDIHVSFFSLHDGWDFYQGIKEGTYDCISKFEADPCALAQEFHFFDVRNPMFRALAAVMSE